VQTCALPIYPAGPAGNRDGGTALRPLCSPVVFVVRVFQVPVADIGIGTGAARTAVGAQTAEVEVPTITPRTQILVFVAPGVTLQTVDITTGPPVARRIAAGPLDQCPQALLGGGVVEVVQSIQVQRTLHGADVVLHLGGPGLVG